MTWHKGQWKAICDVCGFEFLSGQMLQRYDGLMVCGEDFDTPHPSDYPVQPRTSPPLPWTRPEPTEVYIEVDYIE